MNARSAARTSWIGASAVGGALVLSACGGGGGSGHNSGNSLVDPVIPLVGTTGKYSQTPEEANKSKGATKPPVMPTAAGAENQFIRLEVPFDVNRSEIVSDDSIYAAFSQLIGNLSITDQLGNHVPGIALVNGTDAFGVPRGLDAGFPSDINAGGGDNNIGPGVILYVADDGDDDLSTICAFGGHSGDSDGRPDTTDITQIRIALNTLNGRPVDAFYTVTVDDGTVGDILGPKVLSLVPDQPDPENPLDLTKCAPTSRFIVHFNEPCVPTNVGKTMVLDGTPFFGNIPLIPTPPLLPVPPLPNTHITAQLNSGASPMYLPCDVRPLNSNNLATYVITPLVDLPPQRSIDLVIVDANANQDPNNGQLFGATDLWGNFHTPGAEVRQTFGVGKGRAPVNAPVCPEVFYWLPVAGRGIGAIDLNGYGFTTNTPGKWDNTTINPNTGLREYDPVKSEELYRKAPLIVRGSGDTTASFGIFGIGNQYVFPVGVGSYLYGPPLPGTTVPFSIGTQSWVGNGTNDAGNPGTPIPGINEGSSGFETLVRNAEGDVILTGRESGDVGTVSDLVVGDFLDAANFDTQNFFAASSFHTELFWGGGGARNFLADPPLPNPPPSRYWVGLSPVSIIVDQVDPLGKARIIEGAEVFAGGAKSYGQLLPDVDSPLNWDNETPPLAGFELGPNPQTATFVKAYTARQQIGNYLYAVDIENKALQVINSNTFQTMATLSLPDPAGVAIMANNRYVFTSNAGDDTMSIIGADPTQVDFHQEVARIPVGRGPETISCQIDGEDVFVCNKFDDTISIVELGTLTVRKTLDTLIDGPRDLVLTARQGGFGWAAGVYFGYIANFTGNSVVVYESGPDGPQGIGCNNVLGALPTQGSEFEIFEPRGLVYSPYPNEEGLYAGGVYVAHRDNVGHGLISHIQFTHQAIFGPLPCVLPPGQFFIPPGFNVRIFEITGQWGDNDASRLLGSAPSSMTLNDYRYDAYSLMPSQPSSNDGRGVPGFGGRNTRHPIQFLAPSDPRFPHVPIVEPDRLYVAFEDTDRIQILDPIRVGVALGELNETTGIGVRRLVGYYNSQ